MSSPHRESSSASYPPEPPLIAGDKSLGDVTRDICQPLEGRPTRLWWIGLAVAASGAPFRHRVGDLSDRHWDRCVGTQQNGRLGL